MKKTNYDHNFTSISADNLTKLISDINTSVFKFLASTGDDYDKIYIATPDFFILTINQIPRLHSIAHSNNILFSLLDLCNNIPSPDNLIIIYHKHSVYYQELKPIALSLTDYTF